MIGIPYKSVTVQLWAAQMDYVHQHVNVTATGDDCVYVTTDNLSDPDVLKELVDMPNGGYETITQALEFCLAVDVVEIQFYCY